MTEPMLKFKQLSCKLVGSNVICYRLEDETLLKVYTEITRVGVAIDRKNPDGTPLYTFNFATRVEVQTKDRTFLAPPPPTPTQSTEDKRGDRAFVK